MTQKLFNSSVKRIAYLSSYPPRECGIANFTKDLIDVTVAISNLRPYVIAINERGAIHNYDRRVKSKIDRDKIEDYIKAAEKVNLSNTQLVVVQHEFGLCGGEFGEYIKFFLEELRKPVITTLHTVQPDFAKKAIEVLKYITKRSKAIIVIAQAAIDMLKNQEIPCNKCVVIPHGCPKIEFTNGKSAKESLGLRGRFVTSTFGLISSGKGIEYAIQAIAKVIKKEPGIIYLIIGETHPEVRKHEGEKYRNALMKLVGELGLEECVRFTNRFLTKRELIKYLQATDIYLTPYISPNQISSGTLTYALGAGRAVVSTPYYHAQEALANGRGIFCKFKDSDTIAVGIEKLLDNKFRFRIQKKAYKYSRRFLWKNVAKKYINLIESLTENNE